MATRCGDYGTQDSVPVEGINISLNMEDNVTTIDFIGRDDGRIYPMTQELGGYEIDKKEAEKVVCYAGNEGKGVGGKLRYIKIAFKPEFEVLKGHTKRKFYLQAVIKDGGTIATVLREAITSGDHIETDTPFEFYMPDQVFCSRNMSIVFYAYKEDPNKKMEVGIYEFNLYITWRKPGTAYEKPNELIDERLYYYSCTQAGTLGMVSQDAVIGAIWKKFRIDEEQPTGNLRMKDFDSKENDTQLVYYNTPYVGNKLEDLFRNKTAECVAFELLFRESLFVQGILAELVTPYIDYDDNGNKVDKKRMMIQNWTFRGKGTNRSEKHRDTYPYRNKYKSNGNNGIYENYRDPKTGKYLFEGKPEELDVVKEDGLAGQGNRNPIADFRSHYITKVEKRHFDPSYGRVFDSLEEWCEKSIAGIFMRVRMTDGTFALYFRKMENGDIKTEAETIESSL